MANFPVGTIVAIVGQSTSAPTFGWLFCNGTSFSSTTYPLLAKIIPGLHLPNLAGFALLGAGPTSDGDTYTPWTEAGTGTYGQLSYTLTPTDMPSHQHFGYGERHGGEALGFGSSIANNYYGASSHDNDNNLFGSTFAGGTESKSVIETTNEPTYGAASDSTSFKLMQPSLALNFFIYAGDPQAPNVDLGG